MLPLLLKNVVPVALLPVLDLEAVVPWAVEILDLVVRVGVEDISRVREVSKRAVEGLLGEEGAEEDTFRQGEGPGLAHLLVPTKIAISLHRVAMYTEW